MATTTYPDSVARKTQRSQAHAQCIRCGFNLPVEVASDGVTVLPHDDVAEHIRTSAHDVRVQLVQTSTYGVPRSPR
jgi:hypothetical protein